MKSFARLLSLILAITLVVTCFAGCHKKNEVALEIGNIEIKSSTYSCLLIQAYQEGMQKIAERDEKEGNETATYEEGYIKEKIEDKPFTDWVKDRAIEICQDYAATYTLAAENNVTLTDEELSQVNQYAEYYWSTYGMGAIYEQMGVSFETYSAYYSYSQLKSKVFTTIYGEGGSLAVDKNEVLGALYQYHDTYKTISGSYTKEDSTAMTDEEKEALKATYQAYVDRLNAGESFKTIYCEVNGMTAEKFDETYAVATESDGTSPKDPLETVIGAEGTQAEHAHGNEMFELVNALEIGKATLHADESCCDIIYKTDIQADSYYETNFYNSALYFLKSEAFEDYITETYKGLKIEESKYATKQFKVKDIEKIYLDLQNASASTSHEGHNH